MSYEVGLSQPAVGEPTYDRFGYGDGLGFQVAMAQGFMGAHGGADRASEAYFAAQASTVEVAPASAEEMTQHVASVMVGHSDVTRQVA